VGYTPQLSTAVMYVRGNGNGKLDGWLPSYFGADYPTRTWAAVEGRALQGQPIEQFPPPANVVGTPPQSGHAPYVPPPPPPTHTKKPTQSATPTPTQSATPTLPPPSPSKSNGSSCLALTTCPTGNGNGNGGGGNGSPSSTPTATATSSTSPRKSRR